MNKKKAYLKWFSIVVWIGIVPNLYFAIPAFFVPSFIVNTLGLADGFETVWLRNAGLLILIISLYHALAALKPATYPIVGWLIITGRLLAAVYWLIVVLSLWDTSSNPQTQFDSYQSQQLPALAASSLSRLILCRKQSVSDKPDSYVDTPGETMSSCRFVDGHLSILTASYHKAIPSGNEGEEGVNIDNKTRRQ